MRLDQYISQKLWVSRNRAQFFIEQEKIEVNKKIITKTAYQVQEWDEVIHHIDEINYVSRSALKLKRFLEHEDISVKDCVCLDIGASTGGFTQILIEKQAQKIYAVDVGTSQLHHTLRNHEKIVSIENTDIRILDKNLLPNQIDCIVCDVSFISLHMIIDSIIDLMNAETKAILLFKPQFEVGNHYITKKWVVKDEKIIKETFTHFVLQLQKKWVKIVLEKPSFLLWENGNREIFVLITKVWI